MSTETSFNLSYDCRNSDTRDTIMNLSISFDNPSSNEVRNKLNIWLKAIGLNLEVIESESNYSQEFLSESKK
jgi:hypothetical protein